MDSGLFVALGNWSAELRYEAYALLSLLALPIAFPFY